MPKKVLVVEDNSDCRELVVIHVRRMGYQVIEAATGEEAIRKASEQIPDLIIMDLGLPGMSGAEATVQLKENVTTARIPIVAFTAWEETTHEEKARKAGVEAYLTKPTPSKVFERVIQNILSPHSSTEATSKNSSR